MALILMERMDSGLVFATIAGSKLHWYSFDFRAPELHFESELEETGDAPDAAPDIFSFGERTIIEF